jgi:TolB-like protein/Tfp pilus assembly protein PilF
MGRAKRFIQDAVRRRVIPNAVLYIVAAWVAIQVADLAIEAGVIHLELRSVFYAAFLGFPIALIISWFYDITRQGLVRTPPIGGDATFDTSLHRRDYFLMAALGVLWALAVAYVQTPAVVDKSIAIMPFENPGHDPENAMFGFGIRVDLQTQLQNIHDLKVIARDSSDRVNKNLPLSEVGRKLGASYLLKGSVERVLDRVRISVILIEAEKEEQAWAGSYDRALTAGNWFDIRNEISGVITDTLQAELSSTEQQRLDAVPTENFDALQAYFRGKQRMAKRTVGSLAEAAEYFQKAVSLDPEFALAWVGLADSYYLQMIYGSLPPEEMLPKMEAAIDVALDLDGQLGEAYATLGALQFSRNDRAASEAAFKRALELNPNYATAYQWYGSTLVDIGRAGEGLAYKRKAQALDPLSAVVNQDVGLTLENLGRIDEALAQYHAVIEIDPAFPNPYEGIGRIYWTALGRLDEAVVWHRKAVALDPAQAAAPIRLAMIYLELGDTARAEFWFSRSQELMPGPYWFNASNELLHYYRGEEARAVKFGRELLTIDPQSRYTLAHLRNHDLAAGRYAEARARYRRAYPELFESDEPGIDDANLGPAIDLALVLMKTGEQKRAESLLHRALEFLPESRLQGDDYGILDVLVYALQGRTKLALTALRQAIDRGWRTNWWFYLERDPNLESIRTNPEFQAMVHEIKADMVKQLERVKAMEANGELEPVPDLDES